MEGGFEVGLEIQGHFGDLVNALGPHHRVEQGVRPPSPQLSDPLALEQEEFALAQPSLGQLAGGDVLMQAEEKALARPFHAGHAQLDVVLGPVLASMSGLDDAMLDAEIAQKVVQFLGRHLDVPVPDAQTHQLLGRVSQHPREGRIHLGRMAVLAQQGDAVAGLLEEDPAPLSFLQQGLIRLEALADVTTDPK